LRLNDKNSDYWVTLDKDPLKALLDLPEKVFASVDSAHIYAKVLGLKGKELRARIKHFKVTFAYFLDAILRCNTYSGWKN
jgi:hypothetical protein